MEIPHEYCIEVVRSSLYNLIDHHITLLIHEQFHSDIGGCFFSIMLNGRQIRASVSKTHISIGKRGIKVGS